MTINKYALALPTYDFVSEGDGTYIGVSGESEENLSGRYYLVNDVQSLLEKLDKSDVLSDENPNINGENIRSLLIRLGALTDTLSQIYYTLKQEIPENTVTPELQALLNILKDFTHESVNDSPIHRTVISTRAEWLTYFITNMLRNAAGRTEDDTFTQLMQWSVSAFTSFLHHNGIPLKNGMTGLCTTLQKAGFNFSFDIEDGPAPSDTPSGVTIKREH